MRFFYSVMRIRVNGNIIETKANTVLRLLEELNIIPERVAVEVNMKVLKRQSIRTFPLRMETVSR